MPKRTTRLILMGLCLAGCVSTARSENTENGPPMVRSGLSNRELAKVDITANFDMSKGRTLRMRELHLAPCGGLPMHSHGDRPSVAYVVRGSVAVYPEDGGKPEVMVAGQAYGAFLKSHAFRNSGTEEAVVIEVDLPVAGQ